MDASKMVPKEATAMVKSMQMFGYGSLFEDFYIVITTVSYKQETQADLDKGVEGALKTLEAQGASNIVVKTEEFDTQKGLRGKKAYGTLTMIDKINGKSTKMYYELIFFGQNNGLQQIMVFHREDDQYGQEITDRMLNSVELSVSK